MKNLITIICERCEPIAYYLEIDRPIKKIAKELRLTGYNKEQSYEMAIKLVWNTPSTAINGIKYAEKNLNIFCDEINK